MSLFLNLRCTGQGRDELREFELTRALSWLGYPLSSQRRRQLWCRVDLDKSGAIHEAYKAPVAYRSVARASS